MSNMELARMRQQVESHFAGLQADPPKHLQKRWREVVRRLMAGDETAKLDAAKLLEEERAFNANNAKEVRNAIGS
jgi:phage terminase small subunit